MSDDIPKYPSQLADRFQVRMPDGLRDRIADAAKSSGRSMNAEIIARLEASFTEAARLEEMSAALERQGEMIRLHGERIDELMKRVGGTDA